MQEKFALRKTLKKVAALGTSLAMVGVTISGALAAGLGDYSTTFSKTNTVVVFGAAGTDSASVNDVLAGLPGGSTTSTTVETVEGALSLEDFENGEREDMEPGTNLSSSTGFGKTCFNDNDDIGLEDWEQNINIDRDKDYDVHEEFCFGTGNNLARLTSSLDEVDDDLGTEPVIFIPKGGLNYTLVFEEDIDANNRIANASSSKQVKIDHFLGKSLVITGSNVAGTQITALVGTEYQMHTGDTLVHEDCTVKILAVDANEVLVEVNGETKSVDEDKNVRFGDCEVSIDSAIETTDGEGIVVLFVGDQSTETFTNGEHFAGQDKDHFLFEWGLDRLAATRPFLSVTLSESFESDRTDLDDEIMDLGLLRGNRRNLQVGDYICLPNYYQCVVLEGPKDEVDRCTYTIDADGVTENLPGISVAFTGASALYNNAKIVEWEASGCGNDQGFKVDTNGDGTYEQDTDRVMLFWDGDLVTDTQVNLSGEILVYYENANGNETRTNQTTSSYGSDADDANGTLATEDTLFQLDHDDLDNMDVILWDIVNSTSGETGALKHVAVNNSGTSTGVNTSTMALMAIELDKEGGSLANGVKPRLWFELGFASSTGLGIDRMGALTGGDSAKWLRYSSNSTAINSSIASFDNDALANSGIIIQDPEANYDDDKIVLEVPSSDEFEYWVRVTKPKAGVVTTTGTVSSSTSMSDEEVGDLATLGKNVVAVGGPAVNMATADLLGVDFPTYGSDLAGLAEGTAVLEMKNVAGGKMALLVYGWEQDDTRRAAVLLKDPAVLQQKLTDAGKSSADSVTVTGTDLTVAGITVA